MPAPLNSPPLFCLIATAILLAGSFLGAAFRRRNPQAIDQDSASFKTLEGAVLGLLGLLIGFTFSMAVSRYDLRHQLEVDEANAIGTLWLRTDTLAEPARSTTRQLLKQYVPQRIAFATGTLDSSTVQQSLTQSAALQTQLWQAATQDAATHRDPISALFLAALNDTIDVTEKRTSALENRIPTLAWAMLLFIGFVGCALVGISITSRSRLLLATLPIVVGVVLTLVLDLDSARTGIIRVQQHSMDRVAQQIASAR